MYVLTLWLVLTLTATACIGVPLLLAIDRSRAALGGSATGPRVRVTHSPVSAAHRARVHRDAEQALEVLGRR